MQTSNPDAGEQYLLPSKAHVVIERAHGNDTFSCRYVNPDGSHSGIRITKALVTFTLPFLLRHAQRIR